MTSLGTTANQIVEAVPNSGVKILRVDVLQSALATTTGVNPADTFTIDLANYGCKEGKLWYIAGQVHTTLNSVLVAEACTTTVSGTTLTVTIGVGASPTLASSKTRTYLIVAS